MSRASHSSGRLRRALGAVSIALGAIVLVLGFTVAPAHGQAPDQTGWWYELKTKAVPVAPPAPPTVPADGLYVQQGPDGNPMAFGALAYRLAGAASATLTLTASQGSTTTLGAPLQACATTTAWTPPLPAPGYWEDRPTYGKTCTPGVVSTDGKYVAFLFGSQFVSTGTLDVTIVPKDGATPFAIAFDKPGPDSLVVKTAPFESSAFSPPETFAEPVSEPVASATPPFTVAPVSTSTTVTTVATQPSVAQAVLKVAGLGDPDRSERMAALAGSSAIVIGWWLLSARRSRSPRLVGALTGGGVIATAAPDVLTRVGGVGRFSRARARNARALR